MNTQFGVILRNFVSHFQLHNLVNRMLTKINQEEAVERGFHYIFRENYAY